MSKLEKKYFSLLCFNGAGSKLLQAQIGNADDVFYVEEGYEVVVEEGNNSTEEGEAFDDDEEKSGDF